MDFDLFPDGRLVLHIPDVQYYNSYASERSRDHQHVPEALEINCEMPRQKAIQPPLRNLLTMKHVTQGRGKFGYPLTDDPCQTAGYFEPRVFGPTPVTIRPVGKRLAVISDGAAVRVVGGKDQTHVDIASDDGWLYICRRSRTTTLPFRNGDNAALAESNGYLTIQSLEPNHHGIRLKMVQKTRIWAHM